MNGHSLIACSPLTASEVGIQPGHSTPFCRVHFQERNILTAAIAGPWSRQQLENNMAERQDIYLFVYLIGFVLTCEMKAKIMLRQNIVTNTCLYIKSIISIKT